MKNVIQITNTIIVFSELPYIFLKCILFLFDSPDFLSHFKSNYISRSGLSSVVSSP